MPMVGVSYQSVEKDREYQVRFRATGAMRAVIDAAIDVGIRKFSAASPGASSLAPLHLKALKETTDEGHDIEVIPCIMIPIRHLDRSIDAFRRWATYLAYEESLYTHVRRLVLEDPVLNFREGWKENLPASKPYNESDLRRMTIDWGRVEEGLERFVDLPVSYVEPGSETDFLAMAGRFDLLGELIDRIGEQGFRGVLFGVHHAGVTIPKLDEGLDGFDGYLTPLNPIGVMMLPTKASAEWAVRNAKKDVYAIKTLAGGRVEPEEAFKYVFGFDVEGCMVGCASVSEVEEDFKAAIEAQRAHAHENRGSGQVE